MNPSNVSESNQTAASRRQTRSSGQEARAALESLHPIEDINREELFKQQQYEIGRILESDPDDALGQFRHTSKPEMIQVYKQLSNLTHPDKQPPEWKDKATRAQQSMVILVQR